MTSHKDVNKIKGLLRMYIGCQHPSHSILDEDYKDWPGVFY